MKTRLLALFMIFTLVLGCTASVFAESENDLKSIQGQSIEMEAESPASDESSSEEKNYEEALPEEDVYAGQGEEAIQANSEDQTNPENEDESEGAEESVVSNSEISEVPDDQVTEQLEEDVKTEEEVLFDLPEQEEELFSAAADDDEEIYTIYYKGNGATSGSMDSFQMIGETITQLAANEFEKTGYTFIGWNTKKDGTGTAYGDESWFEFENETEITLYAQWELTNYTIKYVLNGGNKVSSNPSSYTFKSAEITLSPSTRKGYTFAGWYSDSAFQKAAGTIPKGSVGNKTFYAKWTAIKYTVKFNGNGSTEGSMSNQKMTYGTSTKLTANAFKKKGYHFNGWNTKKDGSGNVYANKASVKNLKSSDGATITLYAQWAANKYSIVFNKNGGTGSMSDKTCYYNKSYTLTGNKFTRKGCSFTGWNTKKDGSGKTYKNKASIKNLSSKNGATITLYAIWTPNKASLKVKKEKYDTNKITITSQKVTGYKIYRSTKQDQGYSYLATTTDTTYEDETAKAGKTYYYKVKAYVKYSSSKTVYGNLSEPKKITTALKPEFVAYIDLDMTSYDTYFLEMRVLNLGTKNLTVGSPYTIAHVYPYDGSPYYEAELDEYTFKPSKPTNTPLLWSFFTTGRHYYSSGASAVFYFTYDGCSYICYIGTEPEDAYFA